MIIFIQSPWNVRYFKFFDILIRLEFINRWYTYFDKVKYVAMYFENIGFDVFIHNNSLQYYPFKHFKIIFYYFLFQYLMRVYYYEYRFYYFKKKEEKKRRRKLFIYRFPENPFKIVIFRWFCMNIPFLCPHWMPRELTRALFNEQRVRYSFFHLHFVRVVYIYQFWWMSNVRRKIWMYIVDDTAQLYTGQTIKLNTLLWKLNAMQIWPWWMHIEVDKPFDFLSFN